MIVMFYKVFLSLTLLIGTAQSFSADIFRISPYSLKHTNGHLLLNFHLNNDKNLEIEDGTDLLTVDKYEGHQKLVALVAAYINEVRLIDNMLLN